MELDNHGSVLSARSRWSVLSWASVFSVGSAASALSIGSFASILSIGSSASVLSIGSSGAFLRVGRGSTGGSGRAERWTRHHTTAAFAGLVIVGALASTLARTTTACSPMCCDSR